jgi:hypothetical protein
VAVLKDKMVDCDLINWNMAQTIANSSLTFVLILITAYYAWQTHGQSVTMANQLKEMRRDHKIEKLNREMELLIEPLYSIFRKYPSMIEYMAFPWLRKKGVPGGQGELESDYINYSKKEHYPQKYELLHEPEAKMIDAMRSYEYLAQPDLKLLIKTFLASYPYGKQSDYQDIHESLKDTSAKIDIVVKARYDKITNELHELESISFDT